MVLRGLKILGNFNSFGVAAISNLYAVPIHIPAKIRQGTGSVQARISIFARLFHC